MPTPTDTPTETSIPDATTSVAARRRWAGIPAEDRRAARRRLLLDAGFELLSNGGEAAMTVRAVCAAARLNPRYFYENFSDRDELLVAIYDQQATQLSAELVAAVEAAADNEPARVRAGIETLVQLVTDDPRRANVFYRLALGNETLNRRRLETIHGIVDLIVGWADERYGELATGEQIATIAASMVVGGLSELMMSYIEGRLDVPTDQLVDDAVELTIAAFETAARIAVSRAG